MQSNFCAFRTDGMLILYLLIGLRCPSVWFVSSSKERLMRILSPAFIRTSCEESKIGAFSLLQPSSSLRCRSKSGKRRGTHQGIINLIKELNG